MSGTEIESRLTRVFREAGRPVLMPYATGGYPDPEGSARIAKTFRRAGADIVELGIPFSDPLADGPVIQAASTAALKRGIRPAHVFSLAADVAADGFPVVLLSYLNTILARGAESFFSSCAESGVLGVVVPDLPVDEAADLQQEARARGVDVILLAAPTSTDARLDRIAEAASGFIYCVSTTGVTGARNELSRELPEFLARLRSRTNLPLAVGFGVSTAAQAAEVGKMADGVIIGSRLMRMVQESADLEQALDEIYRFLEPISETLRSLEPHRR
ncbi:MAG: tryptophan synthase subunit alpha [Thermoleophilia bacterium]